MTVSAETTSISRVVIVTGASAGVGRAVAQRFARSGDRLGLIARDAAALSMVVAEAERAGSPLAIAEAVDVADPKGLFAAAERLQARLGPVDVWINDAMETVFSPFCEMTADEFRRVTEVTYLGFVHGTMAALKTMRQRGQGRIVQIGSALAYRGIPLQSAYCGAKHGIKGFTESVRAELLHEGSAVTIAMVDLPAVNTPQFDWARVRTPREPRPMGRPIQPEVVAEAVFRVAAGRWREYWLGLPTLETVLGNAVWPGFLDRFLARRAVDGQQTDEPVSPNRPDDLDRPVPALHRTRGSFSAEAADRALLIPAPVARLGVAALAAAACALAGAAVSSMVSPRWPRRR